MFNAEDYIEENYVYALAIGYMLRVIKNGKDISPFKNEFNCIKHGNYRKFIDLIGEPEETAISE